jgi:hypothetical protein
MKLLIVIPALPINLPGGHPRPFSESKKAGKVLAGKMTQKLRELLKTKGQLTADSSVILAPLRTDEAFQYARLLSKQLVEGRTILIVSKSSITRAGRQIDAFSQAIKEHFEEYQVVLVTAGPEICRALLEHWTKQVWNRASKKRLLDFAQLRFGQAVAFLEEDRRRTIIPIQV